LRRALRTIDATRWPERVQEITARLAAPELLEQMPPAAPADAGTDRSLDRPILQRVGKVLVAIGALDIAMMIYVVSQGQSYSSSLTSLGTRNR
jgi:hypothetical protein